MLATINCEKYYDQQVKNSTRPRHRQSKKSPDFLQALRCLGACLNLLDTTFDGISFRYGCKARPLTGATFDFYHILYYNHLRMKLSAERRVAELPIGYGRELSQAAHMFGASSKREAQRNPGGFGRPATGNNADYWENQAFKALRRAIKEDRELKDFYETAQHLGGHIKASITEPRYMLDGPDTASANELAYVTSSIVEILDAKDLYFAIGGKWIERSTDLGSFAIRVINEKGKLYPGLPEDIPTNTAEFWQPVANLSPQQ